MITKNNNPPPPPPQKEKRKALLSSCSASHGLHSNSNHRIDCHGFILLLEQMEKSIAKRKEKKTIVPSWGREQQPTETQLIKEAN
jgi:hypothetical protein